MLKYNTYLFDLDGVLVNTDSIQYETTKRAVKEIVGYDISQEEEVDKIFKSTITTIDKLKFLSKKIFFEEKLIEDIYHAKKSYTDSYFMELQPDFDKIELMQFLKENNRKIAVVTNSNKISTNIILNKIRKL